MNILNIKFEKNNNGREKNIITKKNYLFINIGFVQQLETSHIVINVCNVDEAVAEVF